MGAFSRIKKTEPSIRMPLYTKITIGLVLGAVVGVLVNVTGIADTAFWAGGLLPFLDFVGNAFIRAITMIVIPLVVGSLIMGVASLGDINKLGRLGGKTIGIYILTTPIAIAIGLALALLVRPGSRIDPASRDALSAEFMGDAGTSLDIAQDRPSVWDTLLNMIPSNPISAAADGNMLPLIVFTLIFGAAITLVIPERRDTFLNFFGAVTDASMVVIDWVMRVAPYAVFALIAAVISRFGADVLQSLAIYGMVVVAGLLIHATVTYGSLVTFVARVNPIDFFRRIREVPLIAFSTSSSNATLPVSMETAEEKLGISKSVSSFTLPLGATVNMDGTALYQGVATVFIAQVYGVDLTMGELLTVVLTATLASLGTAGVPSAGIIMLILVLQSIGMAGQAAAGIALILGIDRILDMLRTAVNVMGDLTVATVVARTEGEELMPNLKDHKIEIAKVPEDLTKPGP